MAKTATITVDRAELEGLVEYVEFRLVADSDQFPGGHEERRQHLAYLSELMDLQEELDRAADERIELRRTDVLEGLIKEGAEAGPDRFADALKGYYHDNPSTMREAKGLMSLCARVGLYEGVMV